MLPNLSVGPLTFPTAGLILLLGVWLALTVIERSAKSLRLNAEQNYALAVVVLVGGFVGARLLFVALHWSAFQSDLVGIVWPLTTGYEPVGGVVAGLLAGFLFGRHRELSWLPTLDALSPGIVTGLMAISLADFLGGSGYGTETSLPWAINVFGIKRHPVQIYELLNGGLALVAWWRLRARPDYEGRLFFLTIAIYSGGRLFTDAFRANTWLTDDGYRGTQIVSLIILLTSVFLLGWLAREKEKSGASSSTAVGPSRHQSAE